MSDKKLYKEALEQVRNDYADQVKATLDVNIAIRDDPSVPARDRINASKNILHIMGTPRPSEPRVTGQEKTPTVDPMAWDVSPEEKARLDSILREN